MIHVLEMGEINFDLVLMKALSKYIVLKDEMIYDSGDTK